MLKDIALTSSNKNILKEDMHETKLKIPSKLDVPHGQDFYLWGKAEKPNSV